MFVVLIFGMLFSFILSILEFLWNIRKVAVVEKVNKVKNVCGFVSIPLDEKRATQPQHTKRREKGQKTKHILPFNRSERRTQDTRTKCWVRIYCNFKGAGLNTILLQIPKLGTCLRNAVSSLTFRQSEWSLRFYFSCTYTICHKLEGWVKWSHNTR